MNKISKAVIARLPRYYRYLDELRTQKIERISSKELSEMMNVTASQIRQDLNNFGGFGQQGYGYNVQYLYDEIGKLLGLNVSHKMVIVGAGNLGQAIANYGNFKNRGFEITALFDQNPDLIGKKTSDAEILDIRYLYDYVKEYNVEKIVLGYPKNMNNTEGERCEKTKEFKEMLERRTGLEVILWDERLTTVEAERTLIESNVRRENRKKHIDQIAAVFILQGYLDLMHMKKQAE